MPFGDGECQIIEQLLHNVKSFAKTKYNTEIRHFTINVSFIAALSVRFLTKRYIGEYDHQTGK